MKTVSLARRTRKPPAALVSAAAAGFAGPARQEPGRVARASAELHHNNNSANHDPEQCRCIGSPETAPPDARHRLLRPGPYFVASSIATAARVADEARHASAGLNRNSNPANRDPGQCRRSELHWLAHPLACPPALPPAQTDHQAATKPQHTAPPTSFHPQRSEPLLDNILLRLLSSNATRSLVSG